MRGRRSPLALVAIALVIGSGAWAAEPDSALVRSRAALAARYMRAAQSFDGRFGYEFDFVAGRFLERDSIVRQAGAGSALAEYLDWSGDETLNRPVERAIAYYAAKSVPFHGGRVVSSDGNAAGGNTGATALALLTELFYRDATGSDRFADSRRAWLTALGALQRPNGGFRRAPGSEEESSYYNGEAWLALAHVVRIIPGDPAAAPILASADPYMIATYGREADTQFAHWGLMAAAVRLETTGEPRFGAFITRLADGLVRPATSRDANTCSMVEGLAAGAKALSAGDREAGERGAVTAMAARAEAELVNSLDMQILPAQKRIELGGSRFLEDPALVHFAGAFLNARHVPRARIDMTQHCLSALIKYGSLLDPGN